MTTRTKAKPKIRVTPRQAKDEKFTKTVEHLLNSEWGQFGGVIEALINLQVYAKMAYGAELPQGLINDVMQEVVKMRVSPKLGSG